MRRKNQEGAIVIEATISLTTVMFLIVTILSIVNICLVQARIGTLTHGIAKEISNYTYIYTMAGLNEKEAAISAKADYSRKEVDSLGEIKNDGTQIYDKISELSNTMMDSEFWNSAMDLVIEGGANEIKGRIIDGLCKLVARKRLGSMGTDADSYLRHMGIKKGVEGLDFRESELCSKGGNDIKIIVRYQVHVLEFLGMDFDFSFEQCAYTKTWCYKTAGEKEATDDRQDFLEEEENQGEKEEEEKEASEDEEKKPQKTWSEYLADSTHNASSKQVYLGDIDSQMAIGLEDKLAAESMGMTYFSMSAEDWESLPQKDMDALWNMKERFLIEQSSEGKDFYMGSDPYAASGMYAREVEWLQNNGYTIVFDPGIGIWRASQK